MNYNCKKIASHRYWHKSNIPAFEAQTPEVQAAINKALIFMRRDNLPFEVIKLDVKTGHFSLINSVGWNELYEPLVGNSRLFDEEGYPIKTIKGGKQVYHRKHLFVADDYTGFSIEKSKARTELIESLPEAKEPKFKMMIGSLEFWNFFRERHGLCAFMCEDELAEKEV